MQFSGPSIHLIHLKKNPLILAFAKKKFFFLFFYDFRPLLLCIKNIYTGAVSTLDICFFKGEQGLLGLVYKTETLSVPAANLGITN